jgi:hypothetical protein
MLTKDFLMVSRGTGISLLEKRSPHWKKKKDKNTPSL